MQNVGFEKSLTFFVPGCLHMALRHTILYMEENLC